MIYNITDTNKHTNHEKIHLLKIQSEHKIANTIGLNCPQGQTPLRVQGPIFGLRIPTYQERVPRFSF